MKSGTWSYSYKKAGRQALGLDYKLLVKTISMGKFNTDLHHFDLSGLFQELNLPKQQRLTPCLKKRGPSGTYYIFGCQMKWKTHHPQTLDQFIVMTSYLLFSSLRDIQKTCASNFYCILVRK